MARLNTKLYYSLYCLAFAFNGFTVSFPGAIYVELQNNLNTSVLVVSWIYTASSIGYILASIACGYIADRVQEVHRVQSAILFTCGLCVICVPFTTNIIAMFFLFIVIGIGWAANQTHYTLFVFRLYPTDGTKMYFLSLLIFLVFAVITSSFIQFSISMTNTFVSPFVVFGGIAIVHAIGILFVPTPKHDQYRTVKRSVSDLRRSGSLREVDTINDDKFAEMAGTKLKESKRYKRLQNVTVALLMLSMCTFAMQQGGFLSFTTVYCRDYLAIDDKYGRYFISSYWAGNLLVMILRQMFAPNSGPILAVVVSGVLRLILQIVFIPLVQLPNLHLSFLIMYGLCGCSTALPVAALCTWSELIRPTTGLISCLWWVFYGIGNAVITFSMGALIEQFGAKWIPYMICVPLVMAIVVNGVAVITYKMLKNQELKTLQAIEKETASPLAVETDADIDTGRDTEIAWHSGEIEISSNKDS